MRREGQWAVLIWLILVGLIQPTGLWAQGGAARNCTPLNSIAEQRCNLFIQTADLLQPALGLSASGGNPVPGTASTLGIKLGSTPRVSIGGRLSMAGADLPQILDNSRESGIGFTLASLNLDATIGLFEGGSPLPTLGGVGSVDILASVGFLPLPSGPGFRNSTPFTWSIGLRGGIFRESFTVPGLSLSAEYRSIGRATLGDPELFDTDGYLSLDLGVISLRSAVSKRIRGLGVTAGAGWDRYSGKGDFGFRTAGAGLPVQEIEFSSLRSNRTSIFGNLSYTMMILHLVGELGWQMGTSELDLFMPANARIDTGGHLFGGLTARITI